MALLRRPNVRDVPDFLLVVSAEFATGDARVVVGPVRGGAAMNLSLDKDIVLQVGRMGINQTLFNTWLAMLVLVVVCRWVTRRLVVHGPRPFWQNALEIVVESIRNTIDDIWPEDPPPPGTVSRAVRFVPFVGTLFLFISTTSLLGLLPGYVPPTSSLSTSAALAASVFLAVPLYGIASRGLRNYLGDYLKPTPLMLPFHLLGELSRSVALAVRLFGNMLSGTVLLAVLLVVAPLFFPVLVSLLGLLVGQIQAYIFAVLAMVYLASAAQSHEAVAKAREGESPNG